VDQSGTDNGNQVFDPVGYLIRNGGRKLAYGQLAIASSVTNTNDKSCNE